MNSFYFYIVYMFVSTGTIDVMGGSGSLLMYRTEEGWMDSFGFWLAGSVECMCISHTACTVGPFSLFLFFLFSRVYY